MINLRTRPLRVLGVGLTVLALGASTAVAAAGGATPPNAANGASNGSLPARAAERVPVNGKAALARIGDRLPEVARAHGFAPAQLDQALRTDETLHVDDSLELLYIEAPAPGEQLEEPTGETTSAAPPVTDPVFQLESLPGANHTIYLDFDGETTSGTSWNGGATIVSPPYDIDNNPDSWSSTELSRIERTWKAVSEDFAPFEVNVTTKEPGAAALTRSDGGDTTWGVRVLFTDNVANVCTSCGGVAYIGSFDDSQDEPVFVFNTSLTGIIEAASHEVGHAMLLAHDGHGSSTYYGGHGSGETSWGPIMGAAYNRNVTQWSKGEYDQSTNTGSSANYNNGEDDLAVITSLTNGNGFGYRADDHGDTASSATPVTTGTYSGLISTTNDVDAFAVSTLGGLTVSASPIANNPNLDVCLAVTSGGSTVATASPSTLAASIDLPSLAAGTYIVTVDGCGFGDPLSNTPLGYTEYASLGQYTLDVTALDAPPDTEPPAVPSGLAASVGADGVVTLAWNPNGESDLAGYRVFRSSPPGSAASQVGAPASPSFVDTATAPETSYGYSIAAVDVAGNVSGTTAEVSVTTPTRPVTPDVASGEILGSGSVSGTFADTHVADGVAETVTETHSGGRPSNRHDRASHTWSIPVSAGNHLLEIEADVSVGGDADTGFELSWSPGQNGPWTALATLGDGSHMAAYDLGAPSGTVYVRVADNDRTAGNNSNGSISVDLLRLTGGTPPTTVPGAVTGPEPGDGAGDVSTDVELRWAPADGAAEYVVQIKTGGAVVAETTTSSTSWSPSGLVADTAYTWSVTPTNAIGDGPTSTWSFTTDAPATGVTVASLTTSQVSAGKGARYGRATVRVVDDVGSPVANATVAVTFSGDITGTKAGTTDASGVAVITSSTSAKKPTFAACVASVSATSLTPVDPLPFGC